VRVCRSADGTASSSPYSAGLCGSFEACVCLRVEVRQAWRQSAITAHARCRLQRTWRRLQRRWVRYVTVNYFNRLCTLFFNLFFILNQWINKEASKPTLRQEADTIQIEFTGMYALSIKVFRNFRLPYQQRLCCRGGATYDMALQSATKPSQSPQQELETVCHQKWRLHMVPANIEH